MVVTPNSPLRGWDGYHSDSFFSGIVIRFSKDGMHYRWDHAYSPDPMGPISFLLQLPMSVYIT